MGSLLIRSFTKLTERLEEQIFWGVKDWDDLPLFGVDGKHSELFGINFGGGEQLTRP